MWFHTSVCTYDYRDEFWVVFNYHTVVVVVGEGFYNLFFYLCRRSTLWSLRLVHL